MQAKTHEAYASRHPDTKASEGRGKTRREASTEIGAEGQKKGRDKGEKGGGCGEGGASDRTRVDRAIEKWCLRR